MRKIFLVGTEHQYQRGEKLSHEFGNFLQKLCIDAEIRLIAEEIKFDEKLVVARVIAKELNIHHVIIDPDPSQYDEYEVKRINRIQFEVMQLFDLDSFPDSNDISDPVAIEYLERMVEQHNKPREKVWLSRIEAENIWPTLVICGADHVTSFSNLLNHNDIQVSVIEKHWGRSVII